MSDFTYRMAVVGIIFAAACWFHAAIRDYAEGRTGWMLVDLACAPCGVVRGIWLYHHRMSSISSVPSTPALVSTAPRTANRLASSGPYWRSDFNRAIASLSPCA